MLKLYNTLTRKKEIFKPLDKTRKRVGIYSCGPTVYCYQHVGNIRTMLLADILKRTLMYNGYRVKHVVNITDVGHLTSGSDEGEDKVEKAAKKEGKKAGVIADFYFKIFEKDLGKLNVMMPNVWPKATEHIKEQIALTEKLEKKGFTYKTSDGIYFDSSKFRNYGKLISEKKVKRKVGKRIRFGEKKGESDFALWKFSTQKGLRQQEWDSPWGIGFPGWHIECSAMSMKYLGESFEIHTGGQDLITVHHTNEIAQSEAATGKKFVNYWVHGAFVLNKGEKVSKSTGGFYTVSDLEEKGYKALHFRYLSLQTHYKKPLSFSFEALDAAKNSYERLKRKIIEVKKEEHKGKDESKIYEERFLDVINDDLNMPRALEVFWKVLEDFNFSSKKKIRLLEKFDCVLGLGVSDMKEEKVVVPKDIKKFIDAREKLRKLKKWAEADVLRQRIRERGFVMEDTPKGPAVRKFV